MNTEDVHFVVLAPLEIEIKYLANAFGFDVSRPQISQDGTRWYEKEIQQEGKSPIRVRFVKLTRQGALYAAVSTTKLAIKWKPWCIVSFGIAGSLSKDDINLRDVLIADSVFYYEPAKETVSKTRTKSSRTNRRHAEKDTQLSQVIQEEPTVFTASPSLTALAISQSPMERRNHQVLLGPLASGEKLIADLRSPSRDRIIGLNRKMLGVEKEAAGVAEAVRDLPEIPNMQLLVVKGISDDATIAKNKPDKSEIKRDRQYAARNAAEILYKTVISSSPPVRDEHVINSSREARELSRLMLRTLPSHFVHLPDQTDLTRIMYPPYRKPPIFYHWRALTHKLHWVDFCVLRVLGQLKELGFPIRPLVTEGKRGQSPEGFSKQLYEQMVLSVAGVNVTWYSQIQQDRAYYIRYAEASGLDLEGLGVIRDENHHWGVKAGSLVLEEWLKYVAWSSRYVGRCILLTYVKHADAYREIRRILTLTPLVVGVNIQINGMPGKFEEPGTSWADIHIEPPKYDSILTWIKSHPPIDQIQEFCRNTSLDCEPQQIISLVDMEGFADMPEWQELGRTLNNREERQPYVKAVCRLVAYLREWNQNYFQQYS